MDAITRGTLDGLGLLLNIIALLVVLVALVTLAISCWKRCLHSTAGPITLQRMLARCSRLAWLVGVRGAKRRGGRAARNQDRPQRIHRLSRPRASAGGAVAAQPPHHDVRVVRFANFAARHTDRRLATMAPERRDEIVALGSNDRRGTLATCMTALSSHAVDGLALFAKAKSKICRR